MANYTALAIPLLLTLTGAPVPAQDEAAPQATETAEATPEPTERAAICGNGLLEPGESCDDCAADCAGASACEVTDATRSATFRLVPAEESYPFGFAVRIAYRGDKLSLPGDEFAPSVSERVSVDKETSRIVARDVGHSLRLVVTDGNGLVDAAQVSVRFDRCKGAKDEKDDAVCFLEGCTGRGIDIEGCACELVEWR